MAASALVHAAAVLDKMGLTVSDAVRTLLTRIANENALPFAFATDPAAHDAWFRAKVQEALDDPRPAIPREEVEAHFAKRRPAALRKAGEGDA
jgi:DNA-damage-inducible protein J